MAAKICGVFWCSNRKLGQSDHSDMLMGWPKSVTLIITRLIHADKTYGMCLHLKFCEDTSICFDTALSILKLWSPQPRILQAKLNVSTLEKFSMINSDTVSCSLGYPSSLCRRFMSLVIIFDIKRLSNDHRMISMINLNREITVSSAFCITELGVEAEDVEDVFASVCSTKVSLKNLVFCTDVF